VSRIIRSIFPPSNLRVVLSAAGPMWRSLKRDIFDSYHPELHYMRGPGPRWREKHAHVTSALPISRQRQRD
jgi:hypothetical protein